ncbi:TIGR04283 family arsenosugar biosynthesis glycosyltransferase [bacterium]|nr:TIGR04283 family arsenosugar biosynthesis glycosyltransferase [bacterium]
MKISIVIPVVNEIDLISQSVERAWSAGADQVIVVDGGSTDGTLAELASLDCDLVQSPAGRASQMNHGVKHSTGDILVFLHADNWLEIDVCSQIRIGLVASGCEFGAFRQRVNHDNIVYRLVEFGNELRVKWQGLIYGDQAFFITRKRFDFVGGFPEIDLMEDFQISRTLRKYGKPLILDGPTVVSPRRWVRGGLVRQTIRNWMMCGAYRLGVSPRRLSQRYRRHDQ